MSAEYPRWAITGAAGRIGTALRDGLAGEVDALCLIDRRPVEDLREHERAVTLDVADLDGLTAALGGCDGVIHLAGYPTEADFHDLCEVNITGTYHVLEAARRAGVGRVVFASSNRITGFYPVGTTVGPELPVRPDSLYGVAKAAGEALCRLYVDKFGLSAICIRFGTFADAPRNTRHLSTWLSHDDAVRAVRAAMVAPDVTYATFYAVSDNVGVMWDMRAADALGFHPVDRAEDFADRFAGQPRPAPGDHQSGAEMTSAAHTLDAQRHPGTRPA